MNVLNCGTRFHPVTICNMKPLPLSLYQYKRKVALAFLSSLYVSDSMCGTQSVQNLGQPSSSVTDISSLMEREKYNLCILWDGYCVSVHAPGECSQTQWHAEDNSPQFVKVK